MNKQDVEKMREIAELNCRYYGSESDSFKECFVSAMDAAAYKEQQVKQEMIKKAVICLDNLMAIAGIISETRVAFIETFKKAMEE